MPQTSFIQDVLGTIEECKMQCIVIRTVQFRESCLYVVELLWFSKVLFGRE